MEPSCAWLPWLDTRTSPGVAAAAWRLSCAARAMISIPFAAPVCGGGGALLLVEHQMRHLAFEIPVNDRECGQVEGGVRRHQHPKAAAPREDGAVDQPDDRRLLGASGPLEGVVCQAEPCGGQQHGPRFGPPPRSQQLAE